MLDLICVGLKGLRLTGVAMINLREQPGLQVMLVIPLNLFDEFFVHVR